jgi:low temperature requirement protein LtrA
MVRLLLPESWNVPAFLVLAVAELLVPIVAERSSMTPWHPRHIAERYRLFTLIVLGESVLWATLAVQSAFDTGHDRALLSLAGAVGVVIVFSIWWLYFDRPAHDLLTSLRRAFIWGYGHYLIFASLAAVGAGLLTFIGRAGLGERLYQHAHAIRSRIADCTRPARQARVSRSVRPERR